VDKAVNYICNPAKTDDQILISSFGCSPETAVYDFRFSLSQTRQSDPNKAFHLIQAFAPGEVTFEEAHRIGEELADELLGGRHSYIVATHIDKGHVHNHIIFCAADNIDHKKYHDCKKSYHHIRRLSDMLCAEHGLSVIRPTKSRGKTYAEWSAEQSGTSLKEKLKKDIDEAIRLAENYDDFISLIRAKGYEVKGETFGEKSLKYISFRPLDRERFIRGSAKTLGAKYTKEQIRERIENRDKNLSEPPAEETESKSEKLIKFPTRKRSLLKDYSTRRLIDTSEEKYAESSGLKHWADLQNLKIAASAYSDADSIEDLTKQLAVKSAIAKIARSSLVETEKQLKELGEILKYADQYQANHIYQVRYQISKNPDAYLRHHETELLLHDGAENVLKRFGIDPQSLDMEKLKSEFSALKSKQETLQKSYRAAEKDVKNFTQKLDNVKQYLERTEYDHAPSL